nr:DNA methyltransferase [Ornithinimicrobium cryptoxanthini]
MRVRRVTPKAADLHRAWLELVDSEGPFLAVPPLKRVWPQGMPQIDADAKAALLDAKPAFERAWDRWHDDRQAKASLDAYQEARDAWVDVVLRDVIGWGDMLVPLDDAGAARDARATSPDHRVTITATGALRHGELIGALVWVINPVDSLRDLADDGWSSTPIDRMEDMLRSVDIPVGIVTDGRWWALVSAPKGGMAASGVVDSQTWVEEDTARDAFLTLLSRKQLVGGQEGDRLPALFVESVAAAEEITEALGVQVRRAVELLVRAFSEGAEAARRRGEEDPLPDNPDEVYEAAVTVMMRVVFLLFAEERDLLPEGVVFTSGYGISDRYDVLQQRANEQGAEALDATSGTWYRLLATSRALHGGATFEDIRIPAYGGSLFDAQRFPFLEALNDQGTLEVTVSDRVMLHVLEAVQVAQLRGQDARRISFRDVDVEQIGYIYEGLLGYTCQYADELTVGLVGPPGQEAEIPLSTLDDLAEQHVDDEAIAEAVRAWAKENQPASTLPTKTALTKAMRSGDTMEDAERALLAVTREEVVRDAVRPWIGLVRRDLRDRPVVVLEGGLLVVETPSRRNAGAHYTPKALAEEVVLHALEPLVYRPGPHQTPDRDSWRAISSDSVLDLKVADIACGSGAFLVATARYLAARLVEAWQREGVASGSTHDLEVRAIREVVAHCLYGADINGMAVEMCKLSLWLVSLDKRLPFSFVDDKVLHGNSLLGLTDLKQLERLHIDPPTVAAETMFDLTSDDQLVERLDVDAVIRRVKNIRAQLATVVDNTDPQRSATTKRRLWNELQQVTSQLSTVADGVVAAGLPLGGKPGRALGERYDNLRIAVGQALPEKGEGDPSMLAGIIDLGLTPTVETDYERWQPLHWCLAVPDVMERGGFDAVVGNPPFQGGTRLSTALGSNLRDWLVHTVANGRKGTADQVAYFFLRARELVQVSGSLGLIATNTVAQGDTREVGLDQMTDQGFTITRAIQSRRWPVKSASLEYAAVWGTPTKLDGAIPRYCDGHKTSRISTLLEPAGRVLGGPKRLQENFGIAFAGVKIFGPGFVLSPKEAHYILQSNSDSADILFPYPHGKTDINGSSTLEATRWVINFGDRTQGQAEEFAEAFARVNNLVRPIRQNASASYSEKVRDFWWQYEAKREGMTAALEPLQEAIVLVQTSATQIPALVPSRQVFDQKLVVIASEDRAMLGVLTSSLHRSWATVWGSTRTADPVYTPSDVFETFPRPEPTDGLREVANALDRQRREIMIRRKFGLTKLYNLINDPAISDLADVDIARMREIHVELDEAVMAAYAWDDLPLDHGFHTYRQMERWTVSPAARVEILDRLLEENHRRAALQDGSSPADEVDEEEQA